MQLDAAAARARDALRDRLADGPHPPTVDVFLVLGSGLSGVADALAETTAVDLATLPGIAVSTVPGHRSRFVHGRLGDLSVLAQQGRVHLYEGHDAGAVTRTVEVAAGLGADTMVITNAAGGLDPTLRAGQLMLITDHLNLTGTSPLVGRFDEGGPVFLDMAGAYDPVLGELAAAVADDRELALREGVYAGLSGPAYETPAEVAMLRTLGATAVGMSTVLEVTMARAHGLRVVGLSSITNVHGEGVSTSHEEVVEVGARVAEDLASLVTGLVERLPGG